MQYIEQFVKEIQEIKPLRTCVQLYLICLLPKNKRYLSNKNFICKKTVCIDTRFSTDTDDLLIYTTVNAPVNEERVVKRKKYVRHNSSSIKKLYIM